MCNVSELLAKGIKHHQAEDLDAAELLYRKILASMPENADALHLLGVLLGQRGNVPRAIEHISRAISMKGTAPVFHNNLGNLYLKLDRLKEAAACYRRALELDPQFFAANANLGDILFKQGHLDQAADAYRRSLATQRDDATVLNALGNVLQSQANFEDAIEYYQRALAEKPNSAELHANLGAAFKECGDLDQALAYARRALELNADSSEFHNNLGNVLKDRGQLDEAIACYRRAMELAPDAADAYSNLLYTLNFTTSRDAAAIYAEHRRWNERFAASLAGSAAALPASNRRLEDAYCLPPTPDMRLRIGYVSPDFRWHPIGRFMLPILQSHDHAAFEIFCYASQNTGDWLTERCRLHADVWRSVDHLSDDQLAGLIRQDKIDVLVDLTMHMAKNRLLAFARKPAPVQVTYLAYPGTTGLETIDYRLTDRYLDPPGDVPGGHSSIYSEQSIWLPETYWCYMPIEGSPPVGDLPRSRAGHVTFGSLNNFCKVSFGTLNAWAELMQALPDARLILHVHLGQHRDRVCNVFAERSVSPQRISFVGKLPVGDYLRLYNQIDIALDPFPYGGGTTTCDALWMGVPVVSLAGQTAVGRGGLSILSNLGLSELVAFNAAEYVQIAVRLANDVVRLSELRAQLRNRMLASPLMDAPRFTRNLEAAYRDMWQRWCRRQ
jgi:predicted O-linked N-acetylglucosamine transferase (SPINDLY family)